MKIVENNTYKIERIIKNSLGHFSVQLRNKTLSRFYYMQRRSQYASGEVSGF